MRLIILAAVSGLSACAQPALEQGDPMSSDLFNNLSERCGSAFAGVVVSSDPQDADFASERLVMHVRDCGEDVLRIPFHVGDDRSRTWVVTRNEDGTLQLKHDHRHEYGTPDVLTMYGGTSPGPVDDLSGDFPADEESRALFQREGIPQSMDNVWTLAVEDDVFVYALHRPGRHFEARFDMRAPLEATPPPPWGAEQN